MANNPNPGPKLIELGISLLGSRERVLAAIQCSEEALRAYERGEKELPIDELGNLLGAIIDAQQCLIRVRRETLKKLQPLQSEA